MLKALLAISLIIGFTDAYATHVSKPIVTSEDAVYYLGSSVEIEGYVEYQGKPTSDVLLDVYLIYDSIEEKITSIRSDQDGLFRININPDKAGDYILRIVSQCRDVHRNICTNQSTSIPIEVREPLVAGDDRLDIRVLKVTDDSIELMVKNVSNEEIIIDTSNFYIDDEQIHRAKSSMLMLKPNDSITIDLTFDNYNPKDDEFLLVYDDNISMITVPEFPLAMLILLIASSLAIYYSRFRDKIR